MSKDAFFTSLLYRDLLEVEAVDLLIKEFQSDYTEYQNACYYFKFQLSDKPDHIRVTWAREFKTNLDMANFCISNPFMQAHMRVKFQGGTYHLLLLSFFQSNSLEFDSQLVLDSRPYSGSLDLESHPRPPIDLMTGAMLEIQEKLVS